MFQPQEHFRVKDSHFLSEKHRHKDRFKPSFR